jgi:hypothetical protein
MLFQMRAGNHLVIVWKTPAFLFFGAELRGIIYLFFGPLPLANPSVGRLPPILLP